MMLALAACQAPQPDGSQYLPAPKLETSTGTVQFNHEGGSSTVTVQTKSTLSVSTQQSWITCSASGSLIDVKAVANENLETRYGYISITDGTLSNEIQVVQFGISSIYFWELGYDIPYQGGTLELPFPATDETVKVSVDVDWISVEVYETSLTLTIATNPEKEAREGILVWSAGEDTRTTLIEQAGNPGGGSGDDEPEPGTVIFSEDFENIDTLEDWMLFDADGDGYYWEYDNGSTVAAHSGTGKILSQSYDNDEGALTPDNWVITSGIKLAASDNYLSFWLCPQDASYPKEHYAAYVTDQDIPESASAATLEGLFTELVEGTLTMGYTTSSIDLQAAGSWENIVVKIPDSFGGKTIHLAFRHFDCSDWFYINLDDVSITKGEPSASSLNFAPATVTSPTNYVLRK